MILLIDNYDSFTYNLVQYLGEVSFEQIPLQVVRNDAITIADIRALSPSHIVISPGPCTPNEAGISLAVIAELAAEIPILGVCLGHQAIVQAFGGRIVRAPRVLHGKTDTIIHTQSGVFSNLPNPLMVTRYHSLLAEPESVPNSLEILARSLNHEDEIMAVRSREHPSTIGVQFHPEAILTEGGKELLRNFLDITIDSKTKRPV